MSKNIWFISDTHFNHANILTFKGLDGNGVRPQFKSVDEMNETMIDRWNAAVGEDDKVYHLGDVVFGGIETARTVLPRLKGRKRLILGNHDNVRGHELYKYFDKIVVSQRFNEGRGFLATHIPIHETSIDKARINFNLHGHIHERPDVSPLHVNISVEKINYTPIHLDEVLAIMEKR